MAKKPKARAAEAIEAIQKIYDEGEQSLASQRGALTGRQLATLADEQDFTADRLGKARNFADPHCGYTRAELKALFAAIREQARRLPRDDTTTPVFGLTHIYLLLTVPKGPKRSALQERAIEECWGLTTLQAAMAEKVGPRRLAGRRRRIPKGRKALRVQIQQDSDRWLRWRKALGEKRTDGSVPWKELSAEVQRQVQVIHKHMYDLWLQVHRELKRRVPNMGYEPENGEETARQPDGQGKKASAR